MAVIISASDVTNVAPEFTCLQESEINAFIEIAKTLICETKWGDKYRVAVSLLTAHLMKEIGMGSDTSSSQSGPVTSEKVGDLAVTYGSVTAQGGSVTDNLYMTTKYGRLFLLIKKTLSITPMVT